MVVEFDDSDLDRLETDAKFDAGFSANVVTAYRKRIQFIRCAEDERAFYASKSWHYEKLQGRPGEHSIRLNDQWRLIVRYSGSEKDKIIVVVSIEDYHR